MYHEYTQTTDVYRWTKRHNGLHFTRVKATTDAVAVSGIPSRVYDPAYLSGTRMPTGCAMAPGVDC
jgi:hypothetical protein